jgi:hypothetical protein
MTQPKVPTPPHKLSKPSQQNFVTPPLFLFSNKNQIQQKAQIHHATTKAKGLLRF